MGRLVEPISEEDFYKLPKCQQWINNHCYLVLWIFVIMFITAIIGVYYCDNWSSQ